MKRMHVAGLLLACALLGGAPAGATARIARNLVADYGADRAPSADIADLLQKAVDEVGAAGGGTIVIPGRVGMWRLGHPVLVGYPDVTIAGEGAGTKITASGTMFLLGLRATEDPPLTSGHFPAIGGDAGWLDASVKGPHFGLRTFDGTTAAAGYFPACPLAFGTRVPRDPSGDYWKDYEKGSGKPTYWRHWPRYTLNLALLNNGTTPIKGVVCGVGAGGVTPATTQGNIHDPLTVWTIESDPHTGKDLRFLFKVLDREGKESIQSLLLSEQPAGPGLHRLSVQLDLASGHCRAWDSASRHGQVVQPVLAGRLDLPPDRQLRAFEYGAFRLGRVTGNPFTGSPSQGKGEGDWTLCGLSLFQEPRYAIEGDADQLGSPQKQADGRPADDASRLFPEPSTRGLVTFLPLTCDRPQVLAAYRNGNSYDGQADYGYWLPQRPPRPVGGTITLRNLSLFAGSNIGMPVGVVEAVHVVLEDLYEGGGGGCYGVGSLNCDNTTGLLELHRCRLVGSDASLYGQAMTIHADNLSGGGGETLLRLVGCRGHVDNVLITGFIAADYSVKLHAGAVGGPLRLSEFCSDNEGMSWVPQRACFYAEPSLDGGKEGNLLSFPGTIYTGALVRQQAVVELADPPGEVGSGVAGRVEIDGVDLMSGPKNPADCIILCHSPRWSGRLRLAQASWADALTYGLLRYTGSGQCHIVTEQSDVRTLPSRGAYLAGCHVIRMPDRQDPATGAWSFRTYRCTRSGVYGTAQEPQWQEERQP